MSRAKIVPRTHKVYFDLDALVIDASKPVDEWQYTPCAQILAKVLPARLGELQEPFGSAIARDMELVFVAPIAFADPTKLNDLQAGLKRLLMNSAATPGSITPFEDDILASVEDIPDDIAASMAAACEEFDMPDDDDEDEDEDEDDLHIDTAPIVSSPSITTCPFTVLFYDTCADTGKKIWSDCRTFSQAPVDDLSASCTSIASSASSASIASPVSAISSELQVNSDNSLVFTGSDSLFNAFNRKAIEKLKRVCVHGGTFVDTDYFRAADAEAFVGDFQYATTKLVNQQNNGRKGLVALSLFSAGSRGGLATTTPAEPTVTAVCEAKR